MTDLHMHSTASDGTDSPAEILEKVREAGIRTFSLTDHDTIEGVLEIEPLIPDDMTFIRGIELTCITDAGKCHILGFNFDPENEDFRALIDEAARNRRTKTDMRLDFLKNEFGIVFSDEEIAELSKVKSAGKPHFGNLLVMKGLAPDRKSAIKKYLDPLKTEHLKLNGELAVKGILSAGGIPVWAHPLGGTGDDPVPLEEFKNQLKLLKNAGLMGLECFYSKYGSEKIGLLTSFAGAMKLLMSAGSDYHGKNKKVRLGELNAAGFPVEDSRITILQEVLKTDRS